MSGEEMSIAEAAAEVVRIAVKAKVTSTTIHYSQVTDGETDCGAWRVKIERVDPGQPGRAE